MELEQKKTGWWNHKIKREVEQKKIPSKKYFSNNEINDDYKCYKRQRENVKNVAIAVKAKAKEKFGVKMEIDAAGNAKMLNLTFRSLGKLKISKIKKVI